MKGKAKGEDQGAGKGKVCQALARTRALQVEEQEEGQGQEQRHGQEQGQGQEPSLWLRRELESSRLHWRAWTFQGGTWHQMEPGVWIRTTPKWKMELAKKRDRILKWLQKPKSKRNQMTPKWRVYPDVPGPGTRQIIRQVITGAQHRFRIHVYEAVQIAFLRSQVPQGPVPRVRGSAAKGAAQGIQDEPAQAERRHRVFRNQVSHRVFPCPGKVEGLEQGQGLVRVEEKILSKLAAVGALQEFADKLAALQARHDLAAAKGKANSARVLAAAKGRVLAALQARHDLAAAEDRADSARALVASRERVLQTALAAAKLQC